jgi:hypothetical protein
VSQMRSMRCLALLSVFIAFPPPEHLDGQDYRRRQNMI